MKTGEGRRSLGVALFLLGAIAISACVRSTGHPADPTVPRAIDDRGETETEMQRAGEEKRDAEEQKGAQEEEKPKQQKEPLVPRMLGEEIPANAQPILDKLAEAEATIATLMKRQLSSEQMEQVGVARNFLEQARAALAEEDLQRAAVLADKGAVLVHDVEEASRT